MQPGPSNTNPPGPNGEGTSFFAPSSNGQSNENTVNANQRASEVQPTKQRLHPDFTHYDWVQLADRIRPGRKGVLYKIINQGIASVRFTYVTFLDFSLKKSL